MTFTPGSDEYCLRKSKDNFFSTKHKRSAASIWLGSIPCSRHEKIMNAKNSQFHAWKLSMKYFCYKSFQEAQHSFHIPISAKTKKGIKSVRLQLDALDKVQIYWSKSIIVFLNFSCLKASSSKIIRDKYFL